MNIDHIVLWVSDQKRSLDFFVNVVGLDVTVRRARPWVVGHSLLRSALSVSPRHEFIQLCDLVLGDAGQRVGEPGLGIDAAEFCRFDQRIGDGG